MNHQDDESNDEPESYTTPFGDTSLGAYLGGALVIFAMCAGIALIAWAAK